ncbi:MAG: GyrI-like domain-containing protein [Ichthyobacteriaceae bacterium]|nr:GyrI-like domain-containing protein [Ichthyobacteriaceae bacterium]
MQNLIKVIVSIIILGLMAGFIWLSTLDSHYDVKRERIMYAPSEVIYDYVSDYKNQKNWSPWYEVHGDKMKLTFSGADKGVDAEYSWSEKKFGEGQMKTTNTVKNKLIEQHITFKKPNESEANTYWNFEDLNGSTKVTWGIKGDMPFLMRAMASKMDKTIGKDFNRGLEKLDSIINVEINKTSVKVAGLQQIEPIHFVGIKTEDVRFGDFETVIMKNYPKLKNWIIKNNIQATGKVMAYYLTWNEMKKTASFIIAMPIKNKVEGDDKEGIMFKTIPAQQVLKIEFKGHYKKSGLAWNKAMEYIRDNDLNAEVGNAYEVYINNPTKVVNPAEWATEMYIPVEQN